MDFNTQTASFHPSSQVWVFPSSRKLNEIEITDITKNLNTFVANWNSHGVTMNTAFDILYQQFIVVSVNANDENASGCATDKLIKCLQTIDHNYQLQCFDRLLIYTLEENKVNVYQTAQWNKQEVPETTKVFQHFVNRLNMFREQWVVPINKATWLP